MQKTTIFYDGGCPLCLKEINHYKRLDTTSKVEWLDIYHTPDHLSRINISQAMAMQRLHVLDKHGHIQSGAWAFATIWNELPYYRYLAKTIRTLHLLPLIDIAYRWFARRRYRSRCNNGQCRQ